MSPDNAWMALQGIETLPMRMEKHCARRRRNRGDPLFCRTPSHAVDAATRSSRVAGRTPSHRRAPHCENAMKVATHLSKHPKIEWVRYPGCRATRCTGSRRRTSKGKGGPCVVIGLKGGRAAGEKMINSLKLFSHVANVGDANVARDPPRVDDALAALRRGADRDVANVGDGRRPSSCACPSVARPSASSTSTTSSRT